MTGFVISPMGTFPPAAGEGFPRFIQFQQGGVDVGDTSVEKLNFTGDAALTLSSDGSTVTVDVTGGTPTLPTTITWADVPGDYTLTLADGGNGLATTGHTGVQQITIPADASVDLSGQCILISQEGGAQAEVVAGAGVTLQYRSSAFLPRTAGEHGVISLIWRAVDIWIVCGDLEAL